MARALRAGALLVVGLLAGHAALANPCPPGNPPTNCAPPSGAILDLNGTPIPHSYQNYTVDFTATNASTNVSFSFRDDPAFLGLDDVSVTPKGGGSNLLTNSGFESGVVGDNAPIGWTYLNAFGAGAAGVVTDTATDASPGARSGTNYYIDGAVQAYDGITQAIATTPGDTYTISFWLAEDSSQTTFSRLSTNGDVSGTGGNGIDLLVYAGLIPTLAVPEPTSIVVLGTSLAGLLLLRRRRATRAAPRVHGRA